MSEQFKPKIVSKSGFDRLGVDFRDDGNAPCALEERTGAVENYLVLSGSKDGAIWLGSEHASELSRLLARFALFGTIAEPPEVVTEEGAATIIEWVVKLSVPDLFSALYERLHGRVNLEESEMKAILGEIADRLTPTLRDRLKEAQAKIQWLEGQRDQALDLLEKSRGRTERLFDRLEETGELAATYKRQRDAAELRAAERLQIIDHWQGIAERAEEIAKEASSILPEGLHDDGPRCRFNGVKDEDLACPVCLAKDELAKIRVDLLAQAGKEAAGGRS